MKDYREIYLSKFGYQLPKVLSDLEGTVGLCGFDQIIQQYAKTVEDSDFISLFSSIPVPDDANSIRSMLVQRINELFFSKISRERALAIANTMLMASDDVSISIVSNEEDLTYNLCGFVTAWNQFHAQEPLVPPAID